MLNQIQISLEKLLDKLSGWVDGLILALPNIVLALIVLFISYFLAKYMRKGAEKAMKKMTRNEMVISLMASISVAIFMILALFIVLNILNLSDAVTALLGTAGVIGLAIGLALQDPLINLFSGVLMSVREMYNIGDFIETNGYKGTIHQINLRNTILMTTKGQHVVIPNKDVVQTPLVNYTRSGEQRVDLECGVSYGDDLEKAKKVALEAVENCGLEFPSGKSIELFYKEFGDSSINFVIRFWQSGTRPADFLAGSDAAIIAIKKAFDENDITIPFPIRTLDFGIVGGTRLDEVHPNKQEV